MSNNLAITWQLHRKHNEKDKKVYLQKTPYNNDTIKMKVAEKLSHYVI